MDEGINKSQIDQAISNLGSTDKNVSRRAFNFLLSRVGTGIIDYQDQDRIRNKFVELASSSDVEVRRHTGNMCNDKICNTNPELALALATLSETEDNSLRSEMKSNFGSIGSNHPIECLEIIQRWLRTNVLEIGTRLPGILQEIAEGDANIVDDFLRSWIAEEKEYTILTYGIPNLLQDMFYQSHKKRLLDLLESTNLNDERQLMVVCKTLKQVLCDQINIKQISRDQPKIPRQFDQDFIDKSFEFVSKLAKSKGIPIAKIEPGETQLNRILAIVDSIEKSKRNVDFVSVKENLNGFPHIKDFHSKSPWLGRAIDRKDASNPLISLLEMKTSYDSALLKYIDNALALFIKDKNARVGELRNGFEAASQLFSAVGELVVCAHFKSSFESTEIQFDVGGKVPDCKINVDGTEILVEIKSLDLPPQLKYSTTMAAMETNRLKEGILKKLEGQIPPIAAATRMPIFIALETTRAKDIDEIDIVALFLGSMQIGIERNPQGQIMRVFHSRAKDSIAHEEKSKLISGIIICERVFDPADRQMKLQGSIHKIPEADVPVNDQLIERIKNGIFDKPLPESISS